MSGAAWGQVAVEGAKVANDAFQKSQDRKVQQAALMLQQQQAYEGAQQDRAGLLMKQQTQERTLQSDAYRKALMAALGLNVQDVGYSKEGGFSGGLRPSALGAQGQQAAQVLSGQAQHALESPEARPELDAYTRFKIGDQQAYQDPTVGKKPGFWAKAGYGLNPFKVDELFKSRDPNYRKPGSVSPVNTTGFMGNAPNTY